MNLRSILIAGGVGVTLLVSTSFSQAPQQQRPAKVELQAIKAANLKLLEQQAATLQRLEELQKEAGQLRILVRRT